jgi:hypothetical protein
MCVASFARPNAGLLVLVQSKHELKATAEGGR